MGLARRLSQGALGQRSGWGRGRGREESGWAGAGRALATLGKFELRARAWASGARAAAFSGGAWGREAAGGWGGVEAS